jgi:hypothetical protein
MDLSNMKDEKLKEALRNEIMILKTLNGRHTCGMIE